MLGQLDVNIMHSKLKHGQRLSPLPETTIGICHHGQEEHAPSVISPD